MTNHTERSTSEARTARIFRDARPRERAPEAHREAVLAAVREEWERQGTARRRTRTVRFALAASLIVGVAAVLGVLQTRAPGEPVAMVMRVVGEVEAAGPGGQWTALDPGAAVHPGVVLRTRAGGVALSTAAGASLRIDLGSELEFATRSSLRLREGRLYFDSAETGQRLEIATPHGAVTNVGTRFSVASDHRRLLVAVRDGAVSLSSGAGQQTAVAGESLTMSDKGELSRGEVPLRGPYWEWAEALAPGFNAANRSFDELLVWFARENGYRIEYADEAARVIARQKVRGARRIEELDLERLELLLNTTGLTLETVESRNAIVIARQP